MNPFIYRTEQFLPVDIGTAWDFFSSPQNLAVITPPELHFKMLTVPTHNGIYEGMIIDYTIRPFLGIMLRWTTEICQVRKPMMFTDKQLRGPYTCWEHTHTFIKQDNGVLMTDEIKYSLPFGILGRIAHLLTVRKQIENIFAYRKNVLNKLFMNHGNSNR